jgi:hypothetical protein
VDDQIKEDEIRGACGTRGREDKCIQVLVVKPEGKSPLEGPRCRWEDIIKSDINE